MAHPLNAAAVLDQEFLELRAELLQAAARLDRLDRALREPLNDPRIDALQRAIGILAGAGPGRAEKIQLNFSCPYRTGWKAELSLAANR